MSTEAPALPGTERIYNYVTGQYEQRWPGDTYDREAGWTLPDPDKTTSVGLKPIPMERSYGCTAYELIVDEKELISNSDIQVFRDFDHAKKRLIAGARAPAGCTRVFEAAHVPQQLRRSLPHPLNYSKNILFVTDQPALVMASSDLALAAVRTFQHIPCSLSQSDLDVILKAEPSLRLLEKSVMFNMPTLGLKKLTKLGKPPRSPQESINERKRNFYLTHSVLHLDLHRAFIKTLETALMIQTGDPTPDAANDGRITRHRAPPPTTAPRHVTNQTQDAATRDIHLDLGYSLNCSLYRDNRVKRTWSDISCESATWSSSVSRYLEDLLALDTHLVCSNSRYGDQTRKYSPLWWQTAHLRSPLIFLRRHRHQVVLEALSLYTSHLSRFTEYPAPCAKMSSGARDQNAAHLKKLHRSLYKLARAMGCRSYPALPTAHLYKGPTHEQ